MHMKHFILPLILTLGFNSWSQNVNIPDPIFKQYCLDNGAINTTPDSEISVEEASTFSGTLDLEGLSISDLTGLEQFVALRYLRLSYTDVSSIDISANIALRTLSCEFLGLTEIDVSNNRDLSTLRCSNNNISNFNASSNPNLTCIEVDDVAYSTNNWMHIDNVASFSEACD